MEAFSEVGRNGHVDTTLPISRCLQALERGRNIVNARSASQVFVLISEARRRAGSSVRRDDANEPNAREYKTMVIT
jgi:hypothetical protein